MFRQPKHSPWGKIQECSPLCPGVFDVNTPGHGGILVSTHTADTLLSPQAQKCGFQEGGYLYFEEDCAACVPLRELLGKKLIKPSARFTPEEYNQMINESVQRYYPDYWQARESAQQMDGQMTLGSLRGEHPAAKLKNREVR